MNGILISLLWFLTLYIFVYQNDKRSDIFSPVKFICLIYLLRNIPFLCMVYLDNDKFPYNILQAIHTDIDNAFINYTIVQTVAFASLIFGIYSYKNKSFAKIKPVIVHYKSTKILIFVLAFIGIGAFLVFLSTIGGIGYLLSNLDNRVEIQSGQFVLLLLPFMTIAVVLVIKQIELKNKLADKILLLFLFILTVLSNSALGGRKTTLYLIVTCVVAYHYFIKKIIFKNINKVKFFIGTLCVAGYIFIIPILRQSDGFNTISSGSVDLSDQFKVEEIIGHISYTSIDVFTANYFNYSNIWYFSTFSTLTSNLFDRGDKDNLPPVDEGVYYYNIINNNADYSPPYPRSRMSIVSLPIENLGFGYANFLFVGVIIAFFLQGRVFAYMYQLLIKYNFHPFMVYFYVFMIFNFNFSSLRVFNLLTISATLLFAIFLQKITRNFYLKQT